jgi:hypothetical protein
MTSLNSDALPRPWWLLPLGHFHSWWWWPAGAALVAADYAIGPGTPFPLIYTLPVIAAAWYSGRRAAVTLAIVLPLAHLLFVAAWWRPEHWATIMATTTVRAGVVLLIALWFGRLAAHEASLTRHVKALEGLLPICAFCKRIRNDGGEWEGLESYISGHSTAKFSHGFCPQCQTIHYPQLDETN